MFRWPCLNVQTCYNLHCWLIIMHRRLEISVHSLSKFKWSDWNVWYAPFFAWYWSYHSFCLQFCPGNQYVPSGPDMHHLATANSICYLQFSPTKPTYFCSPWHLMWVWNDCVDTPVHLSLYWTYITHFFMDNMPVQYIELSGHLIWNYETCWRLVS